jgi:hypothetical protein
VSLTSVFVREGNIEGISVSLMYINAMKRSRSGEANSFQLVKQSRSGEANSFQLVKQSRSGEANSFQLVKQSHSGEANSFQLVKKLPPFYRAQKFITLCTRSCD